VAYLSLKITEILTCVTLNHTQQKELASFHNTIEGNKIVCGVIKCILDCSDTSRYAYYIVFVHNCPFHF